LRASSVLAARRIAPYGGGAEIEKGRSAAAETLRKRMCSPKWWANSPNCKRMGIVLRAAQGGGPFRPPAAERGTFTSERAGRSRADDPASVAWALADKIDTLVGFGRSIEKPTGSKDPYGWTVRRMGMIRLIVITNKIEVASIP